MLHKGGDDASFDLFHRARRYRTENKGGADGGSAHLDSITAVLRSLRMKCSVLVPQHSRPSQTILKPLPTFFTRKSIDCKMLAFDWLLKYD